MKVKPLLMDFSKTRFREVVVYYLKRLERLGDALNKSPDGWGIHQKEFNIEVNHLFEQIMIFEKRCIRKGEMPTLERIKGLFARRFRKYFYHGNLSKWSIDKPFGYAGDFRVIDAIYENQPSTVGYDRLFDNYFQMSAIAISVRNRKEDLKKRLVSHVKRNPGRNFQVMSLASGPCREIFELYQEYSDVMKAVSFDCYDSEKKAHRYASRLLKNRENISFIIENALKIALSKDIAKRVPLKYDFIYSLGLFDYLNYEISVKLVRNLRDRLKEGGSLYIADVRDRYYNPSVMYMEWAGDWNLVYRTDEEFFRIFLDAGFSPAKIGHSYEQQGVIQYIEARR